MNRSHRTAALLRRGALLVVMMAALALYGAVSGGPRAIALHPTAVSTLGASSALAVSEAISPTNQSVNVAARGPNNSLRFYWQVGGTWYGPLGLGGANTTYSAPAITSEGNGNFDIAVQGPGNSIYFYWDASGTWYGPLQVAAPGSAYSTPALDVDSDGHLILIVDGPGNTLYHYWNVAGTWYGPLGIGGSNTAFSAPSISVQNFCSCTAEVFAVGPHNDMREWRRDNQGMWVGPQEWSNDQQAYSAPTSYGNQALFQGPNHTLVAESGGFARAPIGTGGTAYSAPSMTGAILINSRATVEGPSHSLNFFHMDSSGNWVGPAQVGAPGSAFSAPAMEEESSGGTLDLVVQGPGNSLYAFWSIGTTWYGPLQVAGPGTTFGSPN